MKIAIIGAGASGFMAAITAKEKNKHAEIEIIEKSKRALIKVKISGGGRCNVCNHILSTQKLIKNYPRGGNKLKKSFQQFNVNHTINWFKKRKVNLKIEEDKRMFPESNTSQTIVDLFLKSAKKLDIKILYKNKVELISNLENKVKLKINGKNKYYDKVILACGGIPTISGYNWLKPLKLKIFNPVPSLFTFNLKDKEITSLKGISIKNVTTKIKECKNKQSGDLLITHWGFSGPAILKLSAWEAENLSIKNYNFKIQINWISSNYEETLKNLVKTKKSKKLLENYNPFRLPKRLWNYLLFKIKVDNKLEWCNLSKKNTNKIINTLVNDEYEIQGKTTFKEEFVTCGGISLSEIDMNTMKLIKFNNIFAVGELLNIDGVTGGFNFQAAWTTGFLAGKNCVNTNISN